MPARLKGKRKINSSENIEIKNKPKSRSTKKLIKHSGTTEVIENNQRKESLRSSNNFKSNDSSLLSNDSLMNNDGLITNTLFFFTPVKNIKKPESSPESLSKDELVIDKLIKQNYKKIKLLKNAPTRSDRINKLNHVSNRINTGTKPLAKPHSKKLKAKELLKFKIAKSKTDVTKEKDNKEILVMLKKSTHIDSLVKSSNKNKSVSHVAIGSEEYDFNGSSEISNSNTRICSSIENLLQTNNAEDDENNKLLVENTANTNKIVETVNVSFGKELLFKDEPQSLQNEGIIYSISDVPSTLDGGAYEADLILENDIDQNLQRSSIYNVEPIGTSMNQDFDKCVVSLSKNDNSYNNQFDYFYEQIDKIMMKNNFKLQLHAQGFVHEIASIRDLIFFLSNFDHMNDATINFNCVTNFSNDNSFNNNFINNRSNNDSYGINEYFEYKENVGNIKNVVNSVKEYDNVENGIKEKIQDEFTPLNIITSFSSSENRSHKKNENMTSANSTSHMMGNNPIENVEIGANSTLYFQNENNEYNNLILNKNSPDSTVKVLQYTPLSTNQTVRENQFQQDDFGNNSDKINIKFVDINEKESILEKVNSFFSDDIHLVPGTICWAHINKFPYWPCIIFPDSANKINKRVGRENKDRIHVRFFADNGRFSWVRQIYLMPYCSQNDFFAKANNTKNNRSNPYYISTKHKLIWEQACHEADIFIKEPVEIRLNKFNEFLADSKESLRILRKEKKQSSMSSADTLSLKRRNSEVSDSIERVKMPRFNSHLQYENISFLNFCNVIKSLTGLSSMADVSQITDYINGLWQHRLSNSSKRGSNRAKLLADNKVKNIVEHTTIKTEVAVPTEPKIKKTNVSNSRPIEETVEDILKLSKTHLFRNLNKELICHVCLSTSGIKKCGSTNCPNWLHIKCGSNVINHVDNHETILFDSNEKQALPESVGILVKVNIIETAILLCNTCKNNTSPQCFVCEQPDINNPQLDQNDAVRQLIKCHLSQCNKYFHKNCLKYWPQARLSISGNNLELMCPSHICHTCISDDPQVNYSKSLKLIKCVKCPSSYHVDSSCIPAGTFFITKTDIICPRHENSKKAKCNIDWCFMCSEVGDLICCETCPSAFHLDCLKLAKIPDDGYICEQCENGRMPRYGEMVWAKHGSFRYWPGIIIPPVYVPLPVQRIRHEKFSFCVRFLGSHDHSWLNRQRVYLYQDDDWRYVPKNINSNKMFALAITESHKISEFLKVKKIELNIQNKEVLFAPQRYTKIIFNRIVPPVKLQEEEHNACNCDPKEENPCSLYSKCINRICYTECRPKLCLAGEKCENQVFEKRQYAPLKLMRTQNKGYGLFSKNVISSGTFIIEYVGELINDAELKRRIDTKIKEKDKIFYFLNLSHNITIDAGPKGNLARFMNHSCDPNCEAQIWIVNGNRRIGLFAINDIPANTELTFHYNLEGYGESQTVCYCGSENCTGFISTINKKIKQATRKILK